MQKQLLLNELDALLSDIPNLTSVDGPPPNVLTAEDARVVTIFQNLDDMKYDFAMTALGGKVYLRLRYVTHFNLQPKLSIPV